MAFDDSRQTMWDLSLPYSHERICEEYLALKRNIGLAEREILTLVYT
jgi:hypothetical protein